MFWIHKRNHLVHVDKGLKEPHANSGSPHHHERKAFALFFCNLWSFLHKKLKGYESGKESHKEPADSSIDETMGHKSLRVFHRCGCHVFEVRLVFQKRPKCEPTTLAKEVSKCPPL
eukprot:TRINITY_DN71348_c0_g1_i1.p1 TRINITY_DN71348_c0_g1~~TRINITY_DN71348_c0_g1_i1.p1  ORF type:complete len:116 (-),score=5.55 TRINITY_DN71348_c0_g1_i1:14-361(-)